MLLTVLHLNYTQVLFIKKMVDEFSAFIKADSVEQAKLIHDNNR